MKDRKMKLIEAINKAYEEAHIYGGLRDVRRPEEGKIFHIYGDGVCLILWNKISIEDINADDWEFVERHTR